MKLRTNLTVKTALGYVTIAVLSIIVFVSSFFVLGSARRIDQNISENIVPSLILCKDMNMLLGEIRRLDNSWIYTPDADEKQRLNEILTTEVTILIERINQLQQKSFAADHSERMQQLSAAMENIVKKSHQLTTILASDESYADDANVDKALALYEKEILPACLEADRLISASITVYNNSLLELQNEKQSSYRTLTSSFLLMFAATIGIGVISVIISNRIIIKPLRELRDVINALGEGVIMKLEKTQVKDEVTEMRNSISNMLSGLKESTDFATEIGNGNYEKAFTPLSDRDQMGNALLDMRKSLKKNAEEDQKRSWATTGVARLSEILRRTDLSIIDLGDEIIRFVVKYTESNQGALFILENDESGDEVLYMKACYAYDRKKYIEKKIQPGEGCVGQCFLEGEVIELTEVPSDYVKITTGLGAALPRNLILIPLKINEKTFGVLELAAFIKYEPHLVEFLGKIAESIASSISTVRVNQQTRKLLSEAQVQAEDLRANEEELRQNMEELRATQEQMVRKEKEYLEKIRQLQSTTSTSVV